MSELSMLDIMICEDLDVLERDLYTDDMYVEAANRGGGSKSDNKIIKLFDTIIQKFKDLMRRIQEIVQSAIFKTKKGLSVGFRKSVLAVDDAVNSAIKEVKNAKTEVEVKHAKEKFNKTLKVAAATAGIITVTAGAAYGIINARCKKLVSDLEKGQEEAYNELKMDAQEWIREMKRNGASEDEIMGYAMKTVNLAKWMKDGTDDAIKNHKDFRDTGVTVIKATTICSLAAIGLRLLGDENNAIGRFLKSHPTAKNIVGGVVDAAHEINAASAVRTLRSINI